MEIPVDTIVMQNTSVFQCVCVCWKKDLKTPRGFITVQLIAAV